MSATDDNRYGLNDVSRFAFRMTVAFLGQEECFVNTSCTYYYYTEEKLKLENWKTRLQRKGKKEAQVLRSRGHISSSGISKNNGQGLAKF